MIQLISCIIAGLAVISAGLLITSKPPGFNIRRLLKRNYGINSISSRWPFKPVLDHLTRNKSGYLYKLETRILKGAESILTIQSLYLVKFSALILSVILVLFIRYTNIAVMKQSIIERPAATISLFAGSSAEDYKRNAMLYMQILKTIGQDALERMDDNAIVTAAGDVLSGIFHGSDRDSVKDQAQNFLSTYRRVNSIPFMDMQSLIVILISFWLPELVLISKRLLLLNLYRKEVIKLENVFELLGTVPGIKTIDILKEMGRASRIYHKHLDRCMEQFKIEKEEALDSVKGSVHNSRFARLVDVIRVFSLTDRKLALQILERNRMEQEEEMLITAQEDIDAVDLVAFLSIIPVVYMLINLLLKPMLDTIFEVFKYV